MLATTLPCSSISAGSCTDTTTDLSSASGVLIVVPSIGYLTHKVYAKNSVFYNIKTLCVVYNKSINNQTCYSLEVRANRTLCRNGN